MLQLRVEEAQTGQRLVFAQAVALLKAGCSECDGFGGQKLIEQLAQMARDDIPPPPLGADDERHARFDPRYAGIDPALLPATESLQDTLARVLQVWNARIAPELRAGRNVMVAAHGNSLRAMVKMLDGVSESEITELNIPTGVPLLYELDAALKPRGSRYLGDPATIAAAAEAVKRQTEKR